MQGALLLSVLLLVLFSFKISGAVREEMALAKDSLSWPKAPAEVIDSKLKKCSHIPGQILDSRL